MNTLGSYVWDAPLKSFADPDAGYDATSTDRNESSALTDLHEPVISIDTDGAARASWLARHFDVAAQIVTVGDLVTAAVDAGLDGPTFIALRRVSSGFAVLRDRLYALREAATPDDAALVPSSPFVRYVDCVYWWVGQLLGEIENALVAARSDHDALERALMRAFEFSALYSLAHIAPQYDECNGDLTSPIATACGRAAAEVSWLTWQLRDAIEA